MDALSHSADCHVDIDHLLFNQRWERGRRCGSESEMQSPPVTVHKQLMDLISANEATH